VVQFRHLLRLEILAGLALLASCTPTARVDETRQATGVKVGEVTDTSAIVWMRVTEKAERRADGVVRRGRAKEALPSELRPKDLEGSVPGAPGRVRLRYGTGDDLAGAKQTGWADVSAEDDFTHKFHLNDLKSSTVYHYSAETSGPGGSPLYLPLRGRFKTAPPPDEYGEVTFTVITDRMIEGAEKKLLQEKAVRRDDIVALVAGTPIARRGTTNLLKLHRIGHA